MDINRSLYYYHLNNPQNSYEKSNELMEEEIKQIYEGSKGRYGAPKITMVLKSKGFKISEKRVSKIMRKAGLRSITVKRFNHCTSDKQDNTRVYPNLLEQNFIAEKPGQKWVGDITYIYTIETGWTYLAIVMDLFDLRVIG